MKKRTLPEVNAGSMADIAFLLLIFFLVTTTISQDKGIFRNLPQENKNASLINERNILEIFLNETNELLVEDDIISLSELKNIAMDFIDNGGITQPTDEQYCGYCLGARDPSSSDHPNKAVISLTTNREVVYKTYIAVQNELTAAYNNLRNRESLRLYGHDFTTTKASIREGLYKGNANVTKRELKKIQGMYPLYIVEVETRKQL